jgi:hypothetical protein
MVAVSTGFQETSPFQQYMLQESAAVFALSK